MNAFLLIYRVVLECIFIDVYVSWVVWQAPPIAPGRSALPDPTATQVCEAESRARLRCVFEADADAGMHRREACNWHAKRRVAEG